VKKVTLKLSVNEDRLVLYSTVVALDKLGVDPIEMVNCLLSWVLPKGVDPARKKEFEEMALSVIESIHAENP